MRNARSTKQQRGTRKYDEKKSRNNSGKGSKCKEIRDSKSTSLDDPKLSAEGRDNNPNWYFLDAKVADQVSQLAFQQLADMPVDYTGTTYNGTITAMKHVSMKVASIMSVYMNPSPGVQLDSVYTTRALQRSAINLSGFRLFSKLAAYTGRTQSYGPQDISTMILYMGELISCTEWIRRAFGVCYTMNMYNRAYPKRILESMSLDPDDMFAHYSEYRTRFNAVITRINQVPIPKSVAYFDKCAALYEKVYLDDESPMAQNIVTNIATTWKLDETSYSGGTILATENWCLAKTGGNPISPQPMNYFLSKLETMVDDLMNSSTFNVVYTDLLNLATKIGVEFWKFDYLLDGYVLYPEFNQNFLLMLHNATFTRVPTVSALVATGITPYNDVYPNPSKNALFYNPGFNYDGNNFPRFPQSHLLVDSINPLPSVEDRIEMLKFASVGGYATYKDGSNIMYSINAVLPDHYCVLYRIMLTDGNDLNSASSYMDLASALPFVSALSQIDWAPIVYTYSGSGGTYATEPTVHGDLNFYTTVDYNYMRKVVDFTGFGLYDVRIGS